MDAAAYRICFDEDQLATLCAQYDRRIDSLGAENVKLRKLAAHYDSALSRLCDQMQAHVDCQGCVLGKDYDEDTCAIDELRDAARELGVEV